MRRHIPLWYILTQEDIPLWPHRLSTWGGHKMPMRYQFDLRPIRERRQLTQKALAEMTGVEQPTIGRWEKGDRKPEFENFLSLADALDVQPGELFTGFPGANDGGQHATRPPEDALPSASELADMLALLAPFLSRARDHEGGLQEIGEVLREGLAHRIANPEQPFDRTLGALEILLKRTGADRPASSAS